MRAVHKTGVKITNDVLSHLYNNHVEQARMQLERDPYNLPTIRFDSVVKATPLDTLLGIEWLDVRMGDYKSHPKIDAPVAV